MKLFGEYLIEKNIISSEALVHALIEQLKGLPSTAEATFEAKLLSAEKILAVFRLQHEQKCGFIEAAKFLGFWSEDIEARVDEYLASIRVPLGQVLIKLGSASLEQITHALDDFFAEVESPKPVDRVVPQSPSGNGTYAPFCDLFTPDLRLKLDSLFSEGTDLLTDAEGIQQVKQELYRLKGAARLVTASESDKLLSSLDQLLGVVLGLDLPSLPPELSNKLKLQYEKALGLLWQAQADLLASESEIGGDASRQREFKTADEQIQVLCFDLGFASPKGGISGNKY